MKTAQITILIIHIVILIWYRIDRENSIETINKRASELNKRTSILNKETRRFNESLKEMIPRLDSLNKHKNCFY